MRSGNKNECVLSTGVELQCCSAGLYAGTDKPTQTLSVQLVSSEVISDEDLDEVPGRYR